MAVYNVYEVDPTGVNPDNLVSAEPYVLSGKTLRFLVPKHGAFFTASVVLYDAATSAPLIAGDDYEFPVICQEATLRYGKEIADCILIKNAAVSDNVLCTRQVLGGQWSDNSANIIAIYETLVNDTRPVHWENVLGKWSTYPPAPHPTWFKDIFGFEPLTFVLDRIAQAVTMSSIPTYDMLIQVIKNNLATSQEVAGDVDSDKIMSLTRVKQAIALKIGALVSQINTLSAQVQTFYTNVTNQISTAVTSMKATITSETDVKLANLQTSTKTYIDQQDARVQASAAVDAATRDNALRSTLTALINAGDAAERQALTAALAGVMTRAIADTLYAAKPRVYEWQLVYQVPFRVDNNFNIRDLVGNGTFKILHTGNGDDNGRSPMYITIDPAAESDWFNSFNGWSGAGESWTTLFDGESLHEFRWPAAVRVGIITDSDGTYNIYKRTRVS